MACSSSRLQGASQQQGEPLANETVWRCLQGICGSIPWAALVFLTLYLQLIGMSDAHASGLVATFLLSTAFGGLLGGWMGDAADARFPQHGRIAVTQARDCMPQAFLLPVGSQAVLPNLPHCLPACLPLGQACSSALAPAFRLPSSCSRCVRAVHAFLQQSRVCLLSLRLTSLPPCTHVAQGLPRDGSAPTVAIYATVMALMALLKAWPAPALNNPVFAEIVPSSQRSLCYSIDRCLEGEAWFSCHEWRRRVALHTVRQS